MTVGKLFQDFSEFSSLQSVLSVNFASLTYSLFSIGGCAKTCLMRMFLFCTFHTKPGQLSIVSPTAWFVSEWPSLQLPVRLFCTCTPHSHSGTPSGSWQEPAAKKRGLANVLLLTRQRSGHSVGFFHYQKWHHSDTFPGSQFWHGFCLAQSEGDSCVTSSVSVHSWNDSVLQMSESILALCVKHKSGHCGSENKDNSGPAVSREQNGSD